MATSNWQHISYCCELLFALMPRCVLDVGMGFGRWGMLTREMCDIWRGRVLPDEWEVRLVGVEALERLIHDHHYVFYDRVVVGDALEFLREQDGPFDLVVIGDVLEHFERAQGDELLELARDRSYYTLLNVPLGRGWEQGVYGNRYEQHRSVWRHGDLRALGPICHRFFADLHGRRHGVYLLPSSGLDMADYWRGRRGGLRVASFREVLRVYPWRRLDRRTAALLRRYLYDHPRQRTLALSVYGAVRTLRRKLRKRGRAGEPQVAAPPTPAGSTGPQVAAPRPPAGRAGPQWEIRDALVPVLAVVRPNWHEVTASARNSFPNLLFCHNHGVHEAVWQIAERGFGTVVFSGMREGVGRMALALKHHAPSTRVLLHYHDSLTDIGESLVRARFARVLELAREGAIQKVGCASAGTAVALCRLGADAVQVPYRILPRVGTGYRAARSPRLVGVFARSVRRDNGHTQLMAAAMLEDAEIHTTYVPETPCLPEPMAAVEHGQLPYGELLDLLGQMDLNLYVSPAGCHLMEVAQSLMSGTPCLTSRCHEVLAHDDALAGRLTCLEMGNPRAIAEQAEEVLADRETLGRRCAEYARELNRRAEAAINEFVAVDLYDVTDSEGGRATSQGDGSGGVTPDEWP